MNLGVKTTKAGFAIKSCIIVERCWSFGNSRHLDGGGQGGVMMMRARSSRAPAK